MPPLSTLSMRDSCDSDGAGVTMRSHSSTACSGTAPQPEDKMPRQLSANSQRACRLELCLQLAILVERRDAWTTVKPTNELAADPHTRQARLSSELE